MTNYSPLPGHLFHRGRQFVCPCGGKEFKVELGAEPTRFWCDCGTMYTEYLIDQMGEERKEVMDSGV